MARCLDAFIRRCFTPSPSVWQNHPSPPPPHLHSQTHLISFLSAKENASEEDSTSLMSSRCRRRWWQGRITLRAKPCKYVSARGNITLGCLQMWERVNAQNSHTIDQEAKLNAAPAGSRWKLLLRKLRARMKWMRINCISYPQEHPLHDFLYDPVSYALNFDDGCYRAPYVPSSYTSPASIPFLS